ncbi:YLS9 protein [Spatholobus suberectus]|nr:YLS9 protein [Spatholobus suberectus]
MTSEAYGPPRYVTLENQDHGHKARRHRGSSGCGCLSCCCCCCSCCRCCIFMILFIIIVLVGIVVGLYCLLKPNIPSYNFESIDIKSFDIQKENKVYTDMVIAVKAENPNEDVGLDYLKNEVGVMYKGSQLCSGQIPPFLQPGKNTTTINVELKGQAEFGPQMQSQLMQDQKEGKIPLLITVKLPIRLVIHDLVHLRKFVVSVNCSVVIDKVEANKRPNILEKYFTYGVEF